MYFTWFFRRQPYILLEIRNFLTINWLWVQEMNKLDIFITKK